MSEQAAQGWEKLRADLEWRGPNGKSQAHIVLPRALAEAMLAEKSQERRQ